MLMAILSSVKGGDIQQARFEIDRVDAEIISLLQERAKLAQQVGAVKARDQRSAYAPDREREVLERVRALSAHGPLTAEHLIGIYRQVISACRSLEQPLRIGYFGPKATFT